MLYLTAATCAEFKLEQSVNGTTAGEAIGGAFQVTDTGGQSVVGTSQLGQWRVDHGFWATIGSPPVPRTFSLSVQSGETLELSFDSILAQAEDADADQVRVSSVTSVSAHGGTIEVGAAALKYTPAPGFVGLDHFTYVLMDSSGDVAAGAVTLTVRATAPEPPHVVFGPILTNGVILVRYRGVPGLTYTIEAREALETGAWQKLVNVTTPHDGGGFGPGVFEVRDVVNTAGRRFYRAVWPAY